MVKQLQQLREALAVLANDAGDQLAYLTEVGHIGDRDDLSNLRNIDELALQFEDANYVTNGLREGGIISRSAQAAVSRLSVELMTFSGNNANGFWTIGALKTDPRWLRIRKLARKALVELDNG